MDETLVSLAKAHLRVSRPTDNLAEVMQFYRDGLGFEVLYEFNDHDGFDGIMLGHKGAAYHLEFTHKQGHTTARAPTEDNLLVFYLPDEAEWRQGGTAARALWVQTWSRHSTRIGISRARRSKIQTDIEWCCRTRAGFRERVVSK
jgi:catechol 2,3-dioxygenase-like lactoylglutathione lyase family enzyme